MKTIEGGRILGEAALNPSEGAILFPFAMPEGIRVVVVVVLVVVVEFVGDVAIVRFLDLFFEESDGLDRGGVGQRSSQPTV